MEWYQLLTFKDRLTIIERFFVDLSANEMYLRRLGLEWALTLPSAKEAIPVLSNFAEEFTALRRFAKRSDRALGEEIEQLDTNGNLVEQVALVGLRLRMAEVTASRRAKSTLSRFLMSLPFLSMSPKDEALFGGSSISLGATTINLGRLRGITNILEDQVSSRRISDDEVFKPSNVSSDKIVDLIDKAIAEVEIITSISPSERQRISGYLNEAKNEALSARPSWAKIVGALVIVAAITSGLADAPNAARNVKEAIEYILGSSVEKPLQRYLPQAPNSKEEEKELPRTTTV